MLWITNISSISILIILFIIAFSDIKRRIIANKTLLFLFIFLFIECVSKGATPNILPFLCILIVGFLFFSFNIIGAGDIKLLAILSTTTNFEELMTLLLLTGVLGGITAIASMIISYSTLKKKGVPYGVAIALAFLIQHYLMFT